MKLPPRRVLDDYLSNRFSIQSARLKERLFTEGVLTKKCGVCGLTEWNKQPIPLELDHINGNHMDNTLTNLRVICPNCHAQTNTYRGKNIAKPTPKIKEKKLRKPQSTKIEWPPQEELLERLAASNFSALARELGVSDNAIRHHLSPKRDSNPHTLTDARF